MCSPTIALLALSTAATVGGGLMQANSQQAMLNYSAKVNDMNARYEEAAGAIEEFRVREDVRRALAAGQADNAKSGFAMTGTPLLVAAESAKRGELDALTARFNRASRAQNYRSQAEVDRAGASSIGRGKYLGAAATILSAGTAGYMSGAFGGGGGSGGNYALNAWTSTGPGG